MDSELKKKDPDVGLMREMVTVLAKIMRVSKISRGWLSVSAHSAGSQQSKPAVRLLKVIIEKFNRNIYIYARNVQTSMRLMFAREKFTY